MESESVNLLELEDAAPDEAPSIIRFDPASGGSSRTRPG
jgi:hypothetical protein